VDGSAGSADALRWAVRHAEATGAEVEVVVAWHVPPTADPLVVGGKGAGELPHIHLGTVASHCVQHAPCDVVVVRGGQARSS
jgi:nucleotide-binding universal stress UspA family protein